MGKSKAPPPPDYAAAAKEQGAANVEAAQYTAALNRPTQIDSNGTQTWALKPGADQKNPQAGDWIVTTKLNDTQQALKDQQDRLSSRYAGMAEGALSSIGNTMAEKFDTSKLPQASALTTDGLRSFADTPNVPQNRMGVAGSNEASRQRVTDAMYQRQMAMLQPQMQQQGSDLTSRLAAQGITEGSEAYNRAVDNQARQQADATASARNDAIMAGSNEDSRIIGNDINIAGFNNSNLDQRFNQEMSAAGLTNQMRAQEMNERQAMNSANNTLHTNSVSEALMLRELGMNEANALRMGNQVGTPNFQAYGGGGQIAAAPVYQATSDGYNAAMAANNANNANAASTFGSIAKVGSMAMMSDRRMKTDIVKLGELPSGLAVYSYNYIWGQPHVGVMADEVKEIFPDAVIRFPDGFDRVNYARVN